MTDKEYYEQKEEAEQIKADMDFEIIKDEKVNPMYKDTGNKGI